MYGKNAVDDQFWPKHVDTEYLEFIYFHWIEINNPLLVFRIYFQVLNTKDEVAVNLQRWQMAWRGQ